MQVILLERVENLGLMGDVVKVKDGYARNFLLPQGKALRATEQNITGFEAKRGHLEAENLKRRTEAERVAERMGDLSVVLVRQASDTGQLYGSVSARDIAGAVTEAGFQIDRKQVGINRAIKALGIHPVTVTLHPEVNVVVTVNVARSLEEAEQQAAVERGEAPPVGAAEEALEVEVAEFFEEEAQAAAEQQIAEAEAEAESEAETERAPDESETAEEEAEDKD